jgi:hypothetical protein
LHRSRDVLQRDLALVVETHIDPVTDLIVNSTRDRNASGHSDAFEPRCNRTGLSRSVKRGRGRARDERVVPPQSGRTALGNVRFALSNGL